MRKPVRVTRATARRPRVRRAVILVTGFEPFGGDTVNPSRDIALALDGRVLAGRRVVGVVLPCAFGDSALELRRHLRRWSPRLVVCLGQAGGRAEITPERIAINVDDARLPDNAGRRPIDAPVVARGPAAFWSTLPVKAIVAELQASGIPAAVSQTAGTFVCNHVFYSLMHALRRRPGVRGGFIHVPFLPQQAKLGQPSLSLERMVEAVALAAVTALRTKRDLLIGAGATH